MVETATAAAQGLGWQGSAQTLLAVLAVGLTVFLELVTNPRIQRRLAAEAEAEDTGRTRRPRGARTLHRHALSVSDGLARDARYTWGSGRYGRAC